MFRSADQSHTVYLRTSGVWTGWIVITQEMLLFMTCFILCHCQRSTCLYQAELMVNTESSRL